MTSSLSRLLAVLVLVLTGAACGNPGYDLSAGTYTADEAAQDGLRRITVADTAGMPAAFVRYGMQRGHFAAQGLSVDFKSSGGGTTVIPSLINGELDIAGSNVVSSMIAIDRGLPVKIIAPGTSAGVDASRDFSALLVTQGSPIRTVADLSGKRIAVNALQSVSDVIVAGLMARHGGDFASVTFVEMPFPDMLPAIERGNVDAGFLIEPFGTVGRSQGLREVVQPYAALQPGLQIGGYLAAAETVESEPEMVAAFKRAVRDTARDIARDPESFRAALPKISNLDAAMAARVRLNQWKPDNDRAGMESLAAIMLRIGYLKEPFDYRRAVVG
ncbi:ABC transporter substrate-binding protein [Microtetraspora sp. NBRC 13810]|uniref:ABC transporter substrate-binding protein n=1 Tax=Microtetraspora sp. NBRC 13810 TaxID=3030990 RepID=UPI0024A1FBA4|nr:ABC transporter substrate-binding protein [Microtetraspora sp. NBRC 13810]GLW06422.1 ABC transporter substrate-binding protein [Microtetraspora sp. NBRC 13810]